MKTQLAPKSCKLHGIRIYVETPQCHDSMMWKTTGDWKLLLNGTALLCIVRRQIWAKSRSQSKQYRKIKSGRYKRRGAFRFWPDNPAVTVKLMFRLRET